MRQYVYTEVFVKKIQIVLLAQGAISSQNLPANVC